MLDIFQVPFFFGLHPSQPCFSSLRLVGVGSTGSWALASGNVEPLKVMDESQEVDWEYSTHPNRVTLGKEVEHSGRMLAGIGETLELTPTPDRV